MTPGRFVAPSPGRAAPGSAGAAAALAGTALAALLLLLAGPRPAVAQGGGGYVYVPNQADATVSVVDTETREVVETIDLQALGFPPDAKPHDVAAAPDGSAWYVSLIGADAVVKFNAADEMVGRARFEVPGMIAVGPAGDVLHVGRSMSAVNPPESIGRIETSDMSVERVEVLFPRPHAIAAGPAGDYVHAASLAVNRIAALASDSESPELVSVDGPTHVFVQFAVSPEGDRLVATGQASSRLLVFDRTRPAELPRVATVEVGSEPWHPAFTPDGRHVVFGNKKDDTVSIVDAETWEVAAVVRGRGLSQPHGAVSGADGRYVYVSNNNLDGAWTPEGWAPSGSGDDAPPGSVAVIDVRSRALVDVIPVGHDPNGLGMRPKR